MTFRMKNFKLLEKAAGELVRAITLGDIEEIQKVLNKYKKLRPDLSTTITSDGTTALHFIARWHRQTILEMILEPGIEINVHDNDGATPLQTAFLHNNLDTAKCFIEYGADVNESSSIKTGAKIIHKMVTTGRLNAANILIECGASINSADKMGRTPLHLAMIRNDPSMAKLLLEKGAEIDACDHNGINSLHLSIIYQHPDITKLLIQYNANISFKDKSGMLPLHLSVSAGFLDITKLILKKSNAHINTKERLMGRTPLHLACAINHLPITKLLIDN